MYESVLRHRGVYRSTSGYGGTGVHLAYRVYRYSSIIPPTSPPCTPGGSVYSLPTVGHFIPYLLLGKQYPDLPVGINPYCIGYSPGGLGGC